MKKIYESPELMVTKFASTDSIAAKIDPNTTSTVGVYNLKAGVVKTTQLK